MLPKLLIPVEGVLRFQRVVLPLMHSIITNEGIEIPSPVSLYLGQFLGPELYSRVAMLDLQIRQLQRFTPLEYAELMELYFGMLSMLHYGITCYDDFERFYSNPPAKSDLPKTYFEIIQERLIFRHQYIRELVAAKSNTHGSKSDTKQINEEIRGVFIDTEQDYQLVQAVLEKGHPYYREMVEPNAIYGICQTVIEIKLLKNTVLHDGKKNETEGAFIDYLIGLARSQVDKTNDLDQRLCLMELEAKVSYHIKHDFKEAIALIAQAEKMFVESQCDKSSREYQCIKVEMVAERIIFMQPQLLIEKTISDLAPLRAALDLALTVKPILSYATEVTQQKLYLATSKYLSAYVSGLKRDLKEATLESCDPLQKNVLEALKYLSFVKALNDPAGEAKLLLRCEKIQNDLSKLMKDVRAKRDHLERAKIEDAQKLAELEKMQRDYDEKFDTLLKSFKEECTAKIVERTNKLPAHPVRKMANPVKVAASTVELEKPVELSVSKASIAFFKAHGLEDAQALIDAQTADNKAEAMLYVGDKYLMIPRVKEALAWYEKAIDAFQGQVEPKLAVKEGIEMMLEITRQHLSNQLAMSIRRQQDMENSLYNQIIDWGIKACRQANVDAKTLAMRDQASIDIVYNAGWQEYVRRGMNNQKQVGQPSPATMEKKAILSDQKKIRRDLKKTIHLMKAVRAPAITQDKDFPVLTKNTATLYQPKAEQGEKKTAKRRLKR